MKNAPDRIAAESAKDKRHFTPQAGHPKAPFRLNSARCNNVVGLLSRLNKVRPSGHGSWLACCPAHADRHPSLAVREADDGKVLVHCFAGCSIQEVVSAVGLQLADLFPSRQHHAPPERRPFPASLALQAVAQEALVVAATCVAVTDGKPFTPRDRERLIQAAARLQSAVSAVTPLMRGAHHGC